MFHRLDAEVDVEHTQVSVGSIGLTSSRAAGGIRPVSSLRLHRLTVAAALLMARAITRSGGRGIRTHDEFPHTGFQDRRHRPLGEPSRTACPVCQIDTAQPYPTA